MPKGTKGKKRPADVIGAAVTVAKIATGEIEEKTDGEGKDKAAQELGRKGGAARAAKLSKKRRAEIAKKVAKATYTAAGVEFTDGEKPGMRLVPRQRAANATGSYWGALAPARSALGPALTPSQNKTHNSGNRADYEKNIIERYGCSRFFCCGAWFRCGRHHLEIDQRGDAQECQEEATPFKDRGQCIHCDVPRFRVWP